MTMPPNDIHRLLTDDIERLALYLLGSPTSRTAGNLRFGRKHSVSVVIVGPKRGTWYSHEGGQGGGPVQLIAFVLNAGYAEAAEWGRRWLGGSAMLPMPTPVSTTRAPTENAHAAERTAFARRQWSGGTSVIGSSGEEYLTKQRAIPEKAIAALVASGDCPIRYHPAFRSHEKDRPFSALLVAASDDRGVVHAVQGIRLTNTAEKLAKDAKRTVGHQAGVAVRLPGKGALILAEGPETGLAVWAATRRPVWITLGSVAKAVDMVPLGPVTIARDADPEGSVADIKLSEAVKELHDKGCAVTVVTPPRYTGLKKTDWNDVLARDGMEVIAHAFATAVPWRDVRCALPYYPAPTEPREAALERQRATIAAFFKNEVAQAAFRQELQRRYEAFLATDKAKRGWTDFNDLSPRELAAARGRLRRTLIAETGLRPRRAGRQLVTGSQGSGKSSAAADEIAAITQDLIVWWVVPLHTKAEEQAADYQRRAGPGSMPAMVVRGRSSVDPMHSDKAMCPRHKIVERAGQYGITAHADICPTCPLRATCGYLRQEKRIEAFGKRGLFLMAHEYVFTRSPAPDPGLVVADEAITITAVQEPISFTPDRIVEVAGYDGGNLGEAVDVRGILSTVRAVIEGRSDILAGLREKGVGDHDLAAAISHLDKAEQRRKPSINGGMTDDAITAVLDSLEKTETRNVAQLLRALRTELGVPRAQANTVVFEPNAEVTVNGRRERQPRVFVYRHKTPQLRTDVSVILLDGTGNGWLNRKLFGNALECIHIPVERQADVTGTCRKGYSHRSLAGGSRHEDDVGAPSNEPATQLRQDITSIVARQNGPVFVSASKKVLAALKPELPTNTLIGHFNAVRGINNWEECRTAIIIGREQPSAQTIEELTRPFLRTDPEPLLPLSPIIAEANAQKRQSWLGGYVLQTRGRRMRDGTVEAVEVQVHPDPRCQQVLEQIREAELMQAADRVRPIFNERTILLLNELVCDFTYGRSVSHRELVGGGDRLEQAFARTGGTVLVLSASEQARLFHDLWSTEKAAKRDRERGPKPLFNILFGERGFIQVTYRTGERRRGKPFRAMLTAGLVDHRAALAEVVGSVTEFTIIETEPQPPAASEP